MRSFVIASIVCGILALAPSTARAQAYFVPFVGYDFGGDAGNCPSLLTDCSVKRTSYGVTGGALFAGIIGLEEDFSYAPNFFGESPTFGSNSILTLMTNLVISVPAGPVRPYLTGGIGVMRTNVGLDFTSLASFSNTSFGYNVGGGVMILLPHHLGVRGDLRNMRSASSITIGGITVPNRKISFSRISAGLVLH